MTTSAFELTLDSTEFPCEGLRIHKLAGTEAISRLFSFDLEVVCEGRHGPSPASLLGAQVSIEIAPAAPGEESWSGPARIHGMIAEVDDLLATHNDLRVYRLRITPRAHRLSLAKVQDILLGSTVPAILQHKLAAMGLEGEDVELRLTGTYPPREFVVQYGETDLAFVSRLAEHLGIGFFFLHDKGRDQLVLTDHAGGFGSAGDLPSIPYRGRGDHREVFALEARHRLIPTYYAVCDYNYRRPLVDLTADVTLDDGYAGVIEYGAHHATPAEGQALARVRAEEHRASQLVYTGASSLPTLGAGMRFRLTGHPDEDPLELLVVDVEHQASQTVGLFGAGSGRGYSNTFHAIPADWTYRPPRVTPKPKIAGLLTGIIDAGPLGPAKVARIDQQGRYTVRFLFDTTAPDQRAASHPVRMLQNHVGENYGTHFPLKPGTEVLIGFVDGDPDRPVIVGAAPNPLKPSPVTSAEADIHRTRTSSGVTIDIK